MFQFGVLGALFGGAKPTKASRGDGLSRQWTKVEYVADHTIFSYELL